MGKQSLFFFLIFLLAGVPLFAMQSAETEAGILFQTFLEKNRVWIEPKPQNIHYQLHIEEEGEDDVRHRIWIQGGDKARWEKTVYKKNLDSDASTELFEHRAIIAPGREVYHLIDGNDGLYRCLPGGEIRYFTKGITWETGLQTVAKDPAGCIIRVQDRQKTDAGEVVVLEAELERGYICTSLGILNQSLEHCVVRDLSAVTRIRLGIRLPEFLPLFEEGYSKHNDTLSYRVDYGPEFLDFGAEKAPERLMLFSQTFFEKEQSQVELYFQNANGHWLFKEGCRKKDGQVIASAYLDGISFEPVTDTLFSQQSFLPEDYLPPRRLADLGSGEMAKVHNQSDGVLHFEERNYERVYEIKGGNPMTVDIRGYEDRQLKHEGSLTLTAAEVADLDRELEFRRYPNPYYKLTKGRQITVVWSKDGETLDYEIFQSYRIMMCNRAYPETTLSDLFERVSLPAK